MFATILIRLAAALALAALIITLTACGGGDPEEGPTCEPFVGPVSASHPAPAGFCQPAP